MVAHGWTNRGPSGIDWANGIKESDILKTIPQALRKIIVNFVGGG